MPKDPQSYLDGRDERVGTVFLLPSIYADAEVCTLGDGAPSYSAVMAAAEFLLFERGLPLDTLDVESNGRLYTVVSSSDISNCEILLPKCKVLCANKHILIENIEIPITEVSDDRGGICTVECTDVTSFSPSAIKRAVLESTDIRVTGAVAFSFDGEILFVRGFGFDGAPDGKVRAVMAAARASGLGTLFENIVADIDAVRFSLRSVGNLVAVSSHTPRPLTFFAPDIEDV